LDRPYSLLKAFIGIGVVVAVGTLGYHFIEGWTLLEGLYMTVITITTIGFKEVRELSDSGRIFTLAIIFSGIGMVTYAFVTGSRMIIEGEIQNILKRRRYMKTIEKIQDHFIICGYGRMGSFICQQLHVRSIPFVVVENKTELQDKIMEDGFLLSPGDATEEAVLIDAGIHRARGLVSVVQTDADNVYVVLTARELNPEIEIIARAGEEAAEKKLRRAGATRVISPYRIGGMRLVMGIIKPAVMSFLELAMDQRKLDVDVEEVRVVEHSSYSGKKLIETEIRRELNLIIIAIQKSDGRMVFNPGPETVIEDNDTLIAMGERGNLKALEKAAGLNSL
jgi:voltage-gated potassium channel